LFSLIEDGKKVESRIEVRNIFAVHAHLVYITKELLISKDSQGNHLLKMDDAKSQSSADDNESDEDLDLAKTKESLWSLLTGSY